MIATVVAVLYFFVRLAAELRRRHAGRVLLRTLAGPPRGSTRRTSRSGRACCSSDPSTSRTGPSGNAPRSSAPPPAAARRCHRRFAIETADTAAGARSRSPRATRIEHLALGQVRITAGLFDARSSTSGSVGQGQDTVRCLVHDALLPPTIEPKSDDLGLRPPTPAKKIINRGPDSRPQVHELLFHRLDFALDQILLSPPELRRLAQLGGARASEGLLAALFSCDAGWGAHTVLLSVWQPDRLHRHTDGSVQLRHRLRRRLQDRPWWPSPAPGDDRRGT